MKRRFFSVALLAAGLILFSMPAQALQLLTEDFTGETIYDSLTVNLTDNPANTANDNLNKWIDFPNTLRWGLNTTDPYGSGDIAQHLVQTSDNTNLMFYAFTNPCTDGGTLSLDFDYILTSGRGSVIILGLQNGVHNLAANLALDAGDGVQLFSSGNLALTANSLTSLHFEQFVSNLGDFDVLDLGPFSFTPPPPFHPWIQNAGAPSQASQI